ncbi:uncharacterized protein LOC128205681 isoform X1 [Mya arenaria]|uniref:uncharacterized protein LOC128205681 isoform X1 n=1 Tax=Mya arenaria TaxID=6604 RepID=UPI0022DF236B|nr:uncharacterized protein LOC128205681 isoform X1 [Mya arenaria]XP_052763490.1 uncharacterized protein LOC128205681 isoform X1 [Mya arenaria]XP_052763491.1 uncharacterized protein LOC128205681 isoform X1 [Mya arenaria]XP_052763492.1 uncharacterized protein LOC128205681 isoform X1 [Mya arenaria]
MKDKVKKKLLKCMSFTTRKPKPPVERRHSVNMDGHDFSEKDYEPNEATSDSVSNKSKPPSVKRQNSIRLSKKSDSALSTGTSEISTKSRLRAAAKAVNLIGNLHASEPTYFQEPKQAEDPYTVLKTQACDAIRNAFSLAFPEGEELKLNIDNAFPLLKSLGFNPHVEKVVDLVRESGIESFGEIDPTEFETVVLGLVQTKDAELWDKRLEEKQRQHDLREAEKAKKEADLIKLEADRRRAGFDVEEVETDEFEEFERRRQEEAALLAREAREDQLYDNMQMAFKFIDSDGDGVISTSDVYNLMMGLGEMLTDDELFGMVNVVDLDCDGKVTFDDFRKFLLPQSGDETLITSPAELAQRLIESTAPVSVAYDTKAENADKDADVVNENVGENADVIPNQNADDINGGGVETELGNGEKEKEETAVTSEAEVVTEKTEEDTKKKADYQRKRSMLWGYTSSSSTDTVKREDRVTSVSSESDSVFLDAKQTTPDTPEVITDDGTLDCANLEKPEVDDDNRLTDPPDTPGQLLLDAIKEEDEHSNYDVERKGDEKEVNDKHEQKPDVKPVLHIEHKKKLFSRQSSSASLKTKFTESFVDSGVETMDSVNCSEMLDLPDEYDIDMSGDETEEAKAASTSHPATKHSARAIYDDNQEDEDMVEAHHVHESLSRVSSTESLSKLEDLESEMPTERVKNFVNEIMRIDLPKSPTSGELNVKLKESDRLTRAEYLQNAILQRSATAPSLTVSKSNTGRPDTARRSDIPCSHINIDLTLDTTPKANVRTVRQGRERSTSARSSRDVNGTSVSVSVIDLMKNVSNDENRSPVSERCRWPTRLLTRPRSPHMKMPYSQREQKIDLNLGGRHIEAHERIPLPQRRAQSAHPLSRTTASATSRTPATPKPPIKRPQTASLPMTYRKPEPNKETVILSVHPFANSDALYPNKNLLTSYHHGFKSIWPTGRKINFIQNKKPFESFELNSYSRAIERKQFPFKTKHNTSIKQATPVVSTDESMCVIAHKQQVIKGNNTKHSDDAKKPSVRKLSLYLATDSTPRMAR